MLMQFYEWVYESFRPEPWGEVWSEVLAGNSKTRANTVEKDVCFWFVTDPYIPQERNLPPYPRVLEQLNGSGAKLSIQINRIWCCGISTSSKPFPMRESAFPSTRWTKHLRTIWTRLSVLSGGFRQCGSSTMRASAPPALFPPFSLALPMSRPSSTG